MPSALRARGAIAFTSILLLTACSNSGYEPGSITSAPQKNTEARSAKPTLYVQLLKGDNGQSEVLAYRAKASGSFKTSQPFCSTKNLGFATGIATDTTGNVYVSYSTPNSTDFGGPPYYIYVYKAHCGAQIAQIPDSFNEFGDPRQIAFGNGNFYVADQYGYGGDDSANVAICSLSEQQCTGKLVGSGPASLASVYGVAVDSAGNVYASGYLTKSSLAAIVEWKGGKGKGRVIAKLHESGSAEFAGNMQFDNQGNLLVADNNTAIYVFAGCPSACALQETLQLENVESVDFVLSPDNTTLYAVSDEGSVDVYAYNSSSGLTYEYSVTNGLTHAEYPYSIAVFK